MQGYPSDSMVDVAAQGLNADLDQEGGGTEAIDNTTIAISQGKTTAEKVETAFRRSLRIRIRLGMFDPPGEVPYDSIDESALQSAENIEVNRAAALASMTLLKNDNQALPLVPENSSSIAVIGVQATMAGLLVGNYVEQAADNNWGDSVLTAIEARLDADVAYAPGCATIDCNSTLGFEEALKVSQNAETLSSCWASRPTAWVARWTVRRTRERVTTVPRLSCLAFRGSWSRSRELRVRERS